jgi:predicted DNA-binding antitoxin AbrB/MazE fold protein
MANRISVVYKRGVFVPDEKVDLPEHTRLTVVLPTVPTGKRYDFSDLCGKLTWKGDALAVQRKQRDEW